MKKILLLAFTLSTFVLFTACDSSPKFDASTPVAAQTSQKAFEDYIKDYSSKDKEDINAGLFFMLNEAGSEDAKNALLNGKTFDTIIKDAKKKGNAFLDMDKGV